MSTVNDGEVTNMKLEMNNLEQMFLITLKQIQQPKKN